MALTVAQAKAICTPSELQLVRLSMPREVVKFDARQLTAKIKRSRDLRDKWRDLAKRQTRTTKVESPQKLGSANQRSADKAQLFAETLARYDSQWQAVRSDSPQRASAKNPKIAKPASTPKRLRSAGHRATRATVRGQLTDEKAKRNASNAVDNAKPPATKRPSKASIQEPAVTKDATAKIKKTKKRKNAPTMAAATSKRKTLLRGVPTTPADKQRDMLARTAGKKTQLKKGGQVKIRSHAQAQQQRNQARRDSR